VSDLWTERECGLDGVLPIEGDSSHIERAKHALLRGEIRYQIVGGIGSRGRVWGHATFLVTSLLGAQICLRRAGFLQSSAFFHRCIVLSTYEIAQASEQRYLSVYPLRFINGR
jgi:hypothetical protein